MSLGLRSRFWQLLGDLIPESKKAFEEIERFARERTRVSTDK